MQVGFTYQNRTCFLQPPCHFGILLRNTIVKNCTGCSGTDTRGVDIVFQSDRNAVKRSAELAGELLRIEIPRLGNRLIPQNGDERIQLGVIGLDAGKAGFGELHRGHGPRSNTGGGFAESQGR